MAAYLKDASPVRAPGPAPRMGASPTVTMVGEVSLGRCVNGKGTRSCRNPFVLIATCIASFMRTINLFIAAMLVTLIRPSDLRPLLCR